MGDNANEAAWKANLAAMELLDNKSGIATNTYYDMFQYDRRQEVLTNLHNDDELAGRAHFSIEKETGPNKCQFIVPIAQVSGKIRRRAQAGDVPAVTAKDLPATNFLDTTKQGEWTMKNLTTRIHKNKSVEIIMPSAPT